MTDFLSFAEEHGLLIQSLHPTDRIMRCPTSSHPNKKNGAWLWDGRRGFVFNWEEGQSVHWWNAKGSKPWTEADKMEWARRRNAERERRALRQRRVGVAAEVMLRDASPENHPYLAYKGFPDERGMVMQGALLIPMRDCVTGAVLGLQYVRLVRNEWEKKMLPGQRAKGAALRLGGCRTDSVLVEGYATGLSVHAALRQLRLPASVVVAFSAGNLVHVAGLLKGRRRVFADNDASGAGQKAAEATGLPWTMSGTVGQDANDLHQKEGLMAVCAKLLDIR